MVKVSLFKLNALFFQNDVPKAIERARGEKSSKEKNQIPISAEPRMADLEDEPRVSGLLGKMYHLNTHESADL